MVYLVHHYIHGRQAEGSQDNFKPLYHPATGEIAGKVNFATVEDVNKAVTSAAKAFTHWSQTPPLARARVLFKFKDLLESDIDKLAGLITCEHGKTIADAKGSIRRGIECVEVACGIAYQLKGTFSENVSREIDNYTLRQPLGVCAGVSPFNFPVMVPIWMFIPAIACGNTFVLKPSEKDPSATMRLAELLTEAGLEDGVLNIINGDKEAVDALLDDKRVVAMTSVSSTPVAEYIYKRAISQGKRSHTFGGAKNHCVVMPDADIDYAAKQITSAGYGSAGERCMAVSVVVTVGHSVADPLISALKQHIEALIVGPPTQAGVDIGPLITQSHLDRVLSYIELGTKEGAALVVDGRGKKVPGHEQGFYLGPCLFDRVKAGMRIYQEEIFGPVLSVIRTSDFESALKLVNEHEFGNGTAIFTKNGRLAKQFASQVQVGMVGINVAIPVPVTYHSFGGWKRSIFGDVSMHGDQSIQFYTKLKTVTARWPDISTYHHKPILSDL